MSDITSGIRINALDGINSATASDNDYLPLDTATGTKKITFKEFKKKVLGKTIPDKAVFSDNILKFYHTKETGETSDTFLFQVDLPSISSGGGSGQDGVGISNIAKTGTSGLVDTYTITLTDNSTYTFTVTNGKDGASASTPTLKKLTINGVEYDGTEEVNITIDSSGASIAVDNTLSSTSLNPISNKAVTEEFNNVRQEIPSNTSDLNNDSGFLTSIPVSTSTVIGGVKADAKDSNDTVPVRIGSDGKLYVKTYPTGSGAVVVDSELSSTSENPVQNKVIYDALTHKAGTEDLPSIATETESGLVYPHSSYFMVGTDGKLSPKILEELNDDTTSIKFATSKAIVDYVKSKVSSHNTSTDAHNDIRELVKGLTSRLNALADSDDETLDRMSEIVSYIKYNRSMINGIDTNKVDVSDIVNNLTSNNTNKPLSAKQGRVLKTLIDAITIPEKLPNPNALSITANGTTKTYDGSEVVTIDIPSGSADNNRDTNHYYVTPEQFGAVGDGTNDDTNAFLQAIQTEKPIVCKPYATYLFRNDIILPNLTNINISGNNCTLKNFALKINVNDDETSWNSGESYPQPESTIKNVLFDNIEMDYCIKTGIPLKLQNIKFNNYGSCLKNYGPYMDYMVLDNIIIVYHTGTEYAIDLAYLGDQHVFKEVHCIGDFSTDNFANKFIRISGCNSAKFENCILNGFVDIYDSTVIFDSCHMENQGGIGLGEDADSSNIKFLGCFFWDMFKMPNGKYVEYDSCNIYLTHQAYGNGTNDYLALNTHNTSIDIGDTQSFGRMSLDAYTRKEYESEYSESLCILDSSPLAESGSKNWSLETGTYKYTFFPSNNPLSIENSDYSKSKKELNVTVNSDTSQVRFYVNESYDFIWCYRTSPSGVIKRAICTCETKLWDFGESINGILWTNVNKIPEPMKSIVNIKNDIYYSENGNVNANNVLVVNQSAKSITYKVGESVNYVNYILSDGSQWIDTGIIPDGNTEIEYKFQDDTRTDEWENIFGSSRNSYCVNRYNNWSQTFILRVNDTETLFEVSEEKQQNGCTIKISNAEKTIYLNNISVGTFSASVNATDSIVLFARRWDTTGSNMVSNNGIFKLYYFTIKQNGETVRDFRPAIDEDGVVCLYDNITNKYYYNAGTGSFDYG